MDQLLPVKIPPGMRNTGTVYQAKGRWYTGNFVRFFQDTIQPIGGWSARSLSGATISGVPRSMITYRLQSGTQVLVIGTTAGMYVVSGSTVYDVTPVGWATVTARVPQLDVFGKYAVMVDRQSATTGGELYYWDGNTANKFVVIQTGPVVTGFHTSQDSRSVVVTPERFCVQIGGYVPEHT